MTPFVLIFSGIAFSVLTWFRRRLHPDAIFTATIAWAVLAAAGFGWLFIRDLRGHDQLAMGVDSSQIALVLIVLWLEWRRWRKDKKPLREMLGAKSRELREKLVRKVRESEAPRPVRVPG